MSERRRITIMMLIMITACMGTALTAVSILHDSEIDRTRSHLRVAVQSKARILEAIYRNERSVSEALRAADPEYDVFESILGQISDAHERFAGFGDTGEFTLARRENDLIVFLLSHRLDDVERPEPVAIDSEFAVPMRRALEGLSGTMIAPDYRGETVIAAYEPLADLNLGLVAKIDLA